jgi:hypothetical protein
MIWYTHPDKATNGTQQKHNNDVLDKVTYHLYEGQNIGMAIEKQQQMMFSHLQPKKIMRTHEKKFLMISNNLTDLLTAETGNLSA